MIRFLFIFSFITHISLAVSPVEIQTMRTLFYAAAEDSDSSTVLFEQLSSINTDSAAILLGYKGMSMLLEAKHSWNVYTKFSYFNKGTSLLDVAISKDLANRELRFFRYTVQDNAPSFLGYNKNLVADKAIILEELDKESDTDLKLKIKEYFKLK